MDACTTLTLSQISGEWIAHVRRQAAPNTTANLLEKAQAALSAEGMGSLKASVQRHNHFPEKADGLAVHLRHCEVSVTESQRLQWKAVVAWFHPQCSLLVVESTLGVYWEAGRWFGEVLEQQLANVASVTQSSAAMQCIKDALQARRPTFRF